LTIVSPSAAQIASARTSRDQHEQYVSENAAIFRLNQIQPLKLRRDPLPFAARFGV
jgi:hypothetical protein